MRRCTICSTRLCQHILADYGGGSLKDILAVEERDDITEMLIVRHLHNCMEEIMLNEARPEKLFELNKNAFQ